MTQFALARTSKQLDCLESVTELQDSFLLKSAFDLFPEVPLNEIYRIRVKSKDIDDLILDAQKAVVNMQEFQKTEFYRTVKNIAEKVDDLVFWYGSDYDDLDYTYEIPALLLELERNVNDSFCEAYIRYKKEKKQEAMGSQEAMKAMGSDPI